MEPMEPAAPVFVTCKQWNGSYQGNTCSGDVSADCIRRTDLADNVNPGSLSHVSFSGLCIMNNLSGNSCTQSTTHSRMQTDVTWTAANADDAWLCLDRDQNGTIDNGTELFGNLTPQSAPPPGMGKNGFNALVEYDKTAKGGNADGLITERDSVFGDLRLWQDTNHNGVSEAGELRTLNQLGLTAIECDYKESKKTDQNGNQFRYRAKVRDQRNTQINRWAWDVYLLRDTSNPVVASVLDLINPRTENISNLLRD